MDQISSSAVSYPTTSKALVARLSVCLGLLALCMTCTARGYPSGTRIKPSHFRFATIVEPDHDPRGSGWRAVCIHASLSQSRAGGPISSATLCRQEFGTPIVNSKGPVPLSRAQRVSANVANEVAYGILTTTERVTALACGQFRKRANFLLGRRIRGAKVSTCHPGVPVVTFP